MSLVGDSSHNLLLPTVLPFVLGIAFPIRLPFGIPLCTAMAQHPMAYDPRCEGNS